MLYTFVHCILHILDGIAKAIRWLMSPQHPPFHRRQSDSKKVSNQYMRASLCMGWLPLMEGNLTV